MQSVPMSLKIVTILLLTCGASAAEAAAQHGDRPGPRGARFQPLLSESVGINANRVASVLPASGFSLSIDGDFKLGGHVFKESTYYGDFPFLHSEGTANTALGLYGLMNVTPDYPAPNDGTSNTALGQAALYSTTSGRRNTGVGVGALYPNTDGSQNTVVGWWAMASYTSGGDRNIAVGAYAGYFTDGSDNILIGNYGVAGESNILRIGEATGTGSFQLEAAYIHGVRNAILSGSSEQDVCVDDKNQLRRHSLAVHVSRAFSDPTSGRASRPAFFQVSPLSLVLHLAGLAPDPSPTFLGGDSSAVKA